MFCPLLFGMEIALIYCGMRSRGRFLLFGVLLLGIYIPGQTAIEKPSKFVLGINAGLGRWTDQVNREVAIYPLPSFPLGYGVVVADTGTDVNHHWGFNLIYNFTPKFGLQAEFSRINAEYVIASPATSPSICHGMSLRSTSTVFSIWGKPEQKFIPSLSSGLGSISSIEIGFLVIM
jgi:hypothetical protein